MNLGLLSLLLLALAIVVGFLWNGNVGLLCVGLAMVLTLFYGESISAEDVISGFNTSLFIQMVGVSYLFSIIQSNGTGTGSQEDSQPSARSGHPSGHVFHRHGP